MLPDTIVAASKVPNLSHRERSDRIARWDPGEGLRSLDRAAALTRRYAPTSPRWGEVKTRRIA
jgi:hypothetical protein